jgi:sugar phosphate isomerase/epimerase
MIQSGLLSITFRSLSAREICALAQQANLRGIEWGGDIHVPPGVKQTAREVAQLTRDHGLSVASYGSYYRAGTGADFAPVLESALELDAPSIRVWAGEASANCDAARRDEIIQDLYTITIQAAKNGIAVATEYHSGTLTDTLASASLMLEETAEWGLKTLWQPLVFGGENIIEENLTELRKVRARLLNVHVYHWIQDGEEIDRRPLSEGRAAWQSYFAELQNHDTWALLEFVRDGSAPQFLDDAHVLNELIAVCKPNS